MCLPRRALLTVPPCRSRHERGPGPTARGAPDHCAGDAANRRFSLVYKGDTIGRHVVRSAPVIEDVRVSTEVEVTVKRLFLTVFSYSHRSEERWRDGRLMALKSETTEGGVTFRVDGTVVARGFRVVGKEGPFIAPSAALTSNCLWNSAILEQDTVIDAQHGGVIGLSVRKLTDEHMVIAGRSVAATRFRFITPDLAGTLWYDDAGQRPRLLRLEGPPIARLLSAHPYYVASVIPGGMYEGNPRDVPTFGTQALLVTSARLSEDLAYAVVRAVLENFADFRRLHPALSTLKVEDMVPSSVVTPIHPGALKYYREVGLERAAGEAAEPARRRRRRRAPPDQTAGEFAGGTTVPAPNDGLEFS